MSNIVIRVEQQENLTDRQSELLHSWQQKMIGIDKSVIHMEMAGWKISHYVQNAKTITLKNQMNS